MILHWRVDAILMAHRRERTRLRSRYVLPICASKYLASMSVKFQEKLLFLKLLLIGQLKEQAFEESWFNLYLDRSSTPIRCQRSTTSGTLLYLDETYASSFHVDIF